MPAGSRRRFSLVEYGQPVDLTADIAVAAGVDRGKARELLERAGERVARTLGFSSNPIQIDANGIRVVDVAGMIRLGPSLELEIAPKFLGLDRDDPRWREDFYFLANLSRHGRLLASERLKASSGAPRDLAALVARSLAGMYRDNRRKPLRSYRRAQEMSFSIDGEVDPFDLRHPGPDGFAQEIVRYDRRNPFNASIVGAAKELLPEVSDPIAVAELVRIIEDLPEQGQPSPTRMQRVPGRAREWQPAIDLSNDVLRGLGVSYKRGVASAPGYVVGTWRTWEDLLVVASRLAFGRDVVRVQPQHQLGTRTRTPSGGASAFNVFPDLMITTGSPGFRFLLDAKYKSNSEKGRVRISEADVYEALAFARATACDTVVLAYPALPSNSPLQLGQVVSFEMVSVDKTSIYGVEIEVRGISRRGGLKLLSDTMHQGLNEIVVRVR
jgi:5-methylcytosine-specific restriction enzyme subunit McrC